MPWTLQAYLPKKILAPGIDGSRFLTSAEKFDQELVIGNTLYLYARRLWLAILLRINYFNCSWIIFYLSRNYFYCS